MFSGGPTTDPLSPAGANVPGFPIGADDRAQNFVAQETPRFRPGVIGVARVSYLRNKFLFGEHVNQNASAIWDSNISQVSRPPRARRSFRLEATLPSAIPSGDRAILTRTRLITLHR